MSIASLEPFAFTIFCDDVREENGGKLSYMGVYRGDVILPVTVPINLAKFVLVVNFLEPHQGEWLPTIIRIYLPGQTLDDAPAHEITVPVAEGAAVIREDIPVEDQMRHMLVPITFAPFLIEQFGRMRVTVQRGDTVYRSGSVQITGPDASSSATATESDASAS